MAQSNIPKNQAIPESSSPYVTLNKHIIGGFVTATISRDTDSFVIVTANLGSQEIGKYRRKIDRPMYDLCEYKLLNAGFPTEQTKAAFKPTVPTITVGSGKGLDDSNYQANSFTLKDVPIELQPFIEAVQESIDFIRQSKSRVVRGELKAAQSQIAGSGLLVFDVELSNVGVDPVVFSNPLKAPSDSGVMELTLESLEPSEKSGVNSFKILSQDLQLTKKQLTHVDIESSKVKLLADEKIAFSIEKKFYIKPGSYQVSLTIAFPRSGANEVVEIGGRLVLVHERLLISE